MELINSNPSLAISILGLAISIGALFTSYLSYETSKKSTIAAERSANAAEKSLSTARPFIKFSNPIAVFKKKTNKTVEVSIQLTNIGVFTAEVIYACVEAINLDNQKVEINFNKIIMYPGDSYTISTSPVQFFPIADSNVEIAYKQVDPSSFIFKLSYCNKDDRSKIYSESVTFAGLQWKIK